MSDERLGLFIDGRISAIIGTFYSGASDEYRGFLNQMPNDSERADLIVGQWFSNPHKRAEAASLSALKFIRALQRAGESHDDSLNSVVWLQAGIKDHDMKIDRSMYDILAGFVTKETGFVTSPYDELKSYETQTVLTAENYEIIRVSNDVQAAYAAHKTSADFVAQQFGC